jgi:hypothetical protein
MTDRFKDAAELADQSGSNSRRAIALALIDIAESLRILVSRTNIVNKDIMEDVRRD